MAKFMYLVCFVTFILIIDYCALNKYKSDKAFTSLKARLPGSNITPHDNSIGKNHDHEVHNSKSLHSNTKVNFCFLKNYKNPCWYESLPDDLLEEHNKHGLPDARITINFLQEVYDKKQQFQKKPPRLSCFPYFMLIGAPKCASSDLYFRIVDHPDVVMPPMKENHWWTRYRLKEIAKKDITLEGYTHFFGKAAYMIENYVTKVNGVDYHPLVTGDGSVSYLWDNPRWETFPENKNLSEPAYLSAHYIHSVIPDVKLLVILRNPIDRLFSGYIFFGFTNKSADLFHKYSEEAVRLYTACLNQNSVRYCVYNTALRNTVKVRLYIGIYVVFLEDWFKIFPRNQFMILRTEHHSKNMFQSMTEIFEFLQLPTLPSTKVKKIANIVKRKEMINPKKIKPHKETIELLRDFYLPFNRQLATLLNNEEFLWS